ncbi:MAG: ribose 5-phosphate isomerase A [Rhodobiaceae bacterium]|nr:ribose 5-phosphate isomerase A [Rhodobiaceae bacterium]RPF98001.1 MAG: ribose-5-phosphate isomerase RpiA [Rhizobiales bacterium TMED227]
MLKILIYECFIWSNKFLMVTQQKKINAAKLAITKITSGMNIGLGTGSTANELIKLLGDNPVLKDKCRFACTSTQTELLAKNNSIHIEEIDNFNYLDLTIDGADEIDHNGNMIKGGGGALLREKMIASISKNYIIIVDETKYVDKLGKFPLPVEIVKFGPKSTITLLKNIFSEYDLYPEIKIRMNDNGSHFNTDGGNLVVDCYCAELHSLNEIKTKIESVPGVITSGLFINMASSMILGEKEKASEVLFK